MVKLVWIGIFTRLHYLPGTCEDEYLEKKWDDNYLLKKIILEWFRQFNESSHQNFWWICRDNREKWHLLKKIFDGLRSFFENNFSNYSLEPPCVGETILWFFKLQFCFFKFNSSKLIISLLIFESYWSNYYPTKRQCSKATYKMFTSNWCFATFLVWLYVPW